MALIKTDSQNYIDIANAIRGLTGGTEQYKPEEMRSALDELLPDYGVSYDTFDSDGNVLTATTYGPKVVGLGGTTALTSVNISDTATEIGDYAFAESGITSLELPSDVAKIGYNAFAKSAIANINLPDGLTEIGNRAFCNCSDLNIHTLPESVTTIGSYAFYSIAIGAMSDAALNGEEWDYSFVIPENVDTIGSAAFWNAMFKTYTFKGTPSYIDTGGIFGVFSSLVEILNVPWSEGEVDGAPWGATNATINYNYTESTEV